MIEVSVVEGITEFLCEVEKPCTCTRRTSETPKKKDISETHLALQPTASTCTCSRSSTPTSIRMGHAQAYVSDAIIWPMRSWPYRKMRGRAWENGMMNGVCRCFFVWVAGARVLDVHDTGIWQDQTMHNAQCIMHHHCQTPCSSQQMGSHELGHVATN
jgi:hypothetical protein